MKGTDADYFQAIRRIAESSPGRKLGLAALSFKPITGAAEITSSIETVDQNETVQQLLTSAGRVFRQIVLKGTDAGRYVSFNRRDDFEHGNPNGLHDEVHFVLGEKPAPKDGDQFHQLIAEGQSIVRSISINELGPILGEGVAQHYAAREEALTRLETLTANLVHDLEQSRKELQRGFNQKEAELNSQADKQREALDSEYQARQQLLDDRETQLDARQKTLDDRSSTHVRRELREKLKDVLTQRQQSFSLSPDTGRRRRWVLGGYIALLAAFGAMSALYLSREFTQQETDYWLIGRQISSAIGFVLTAGFFLRWLNRWAQQHADEEFKLKQLEIDIDRASWVVEMAFEWKSEKGEDIPLELIDRLSANLFGRTSNAEGQSMTASDAIASALLDTAAHAKLKLPGGEIDLDKAAIRKLVRDS